MKQPIWLTLSLLASLLMAPAALAAPTQASTRPAERQDISLDVVIPGATEISVSNAQLRWGLNQEVSSGAYFGECNFLSAGTAGDTGSSRVWTQADGIYAAEQGNTRIEKPNTAGEWVTDSWDGKCLGADGRTVGTTATETGTDAQAVMEAGTGTINASQQTATVNWQGSFTVAMYGGMTYWSVTDPMLSVVGGKGTLRATVSGHAADRNDSTSWTAIPPRQVTIATLPKVALGEKGIITEPAYRKVPAEGVEPPQDRTAENPYWGAFPQDFLDFQAATGQGSYWYSSGGLRDAAKVASTLYISYSADLPVEAPAPASVPAPPAHPGATGGVIPGASAPGPPVAPGTVTDSNPVSGVVHTATIPVAQAMNWLGGSLIPPILDMAKNHRDALLWSLAALLALSAFAWIGFKRGWLQWPFRNAAPPPN